MERTALVFGFKIYKGFAYIYCIFNVTHGENVSLPVERKPFSFGDKKKVATWGSPKSSDSGA